jgi:peptide/nickel transport system ATP-binding protein
MHQISTVLSVLDLTVQYGQQSVVDNVTFDLKKGTTLGIVGASGSGKTTLALAIPGLLSNHAKLSGQVVFQGEKLDYRHKNQIQQLRGKYIGFVFQEPMSSLNPTMSCGKQITEILQLHLGLPKETAKKTALDWLVKVQISEPARIFDAYPHELSGGLAQRVMIAIALCCRPTLLIADEPTTALDVTVQKSILDLLKSLQHELDLTMLFVSHDIGVIRYMSNEIGIMFQGKMVEFGATVDVIQHPKHEHTKALLQASSRTNILMPSNPLVLFEHSSISVSYPVGKNFWGNPAGRFMAVNAVPVTIFEGECLGIVGESGSGKSSLAREIGRLMGFHKGKVAFIDQHPQAALNPLKRVEAVLQEVVVLHQPNCTKQEVRQEVARLLAAVQLDETLLNRLPKELSGGQKQRVCIARALAIHPKLLICDEILSALDKPVQAAIIDLIQQLQQELDLTILFISHDLHVVREICDRVIVLHNGILEEQNATNLLFDQPTTSYTQALLSARL